MGEQSGRSAFLKLLIDEGITHLFGTLGTTELLLIEVVRDFPEFNFNYVRGPQEAWRWRMVIRAFGRLAACVAAACVEFACNPVTWARSGIVVAVIA